LLTQHAKVQCDHRDPGGGQRVALNESDAPILVNGRHRGGLRVAVQP
jgi:hypothetical protein